MTATTIPKHLIENGAYVLTVTQVAECIEGIKPATYEELWTDDDPESDEDWGPPRLEDKWPKLSQAAQDNITEALKDYPESY